MIPIQRQPEPPDFDVKVRQKGLAWFVQKSIDTNKPLAKGTKPKSYWTACIPDLRVAYKNICAYVCIYIEEVTGNATVEHFKPKSLHPHLTYEWSNYLLVCGTMNGRKSNYEDVLDPFILAAETFYLNLSDGELIPNLNLAAFEKIAALQTIKRLKLNLPDCKKLRLRFWAKFTTGKIVESELLEYSPFAWLEAKRQGWL